MKELALILLAKMTPKDVFYGLLIMLLFWGEPDVFDELRTVLMIVLHKYH